MFGFRKVAVAMLAGGALMLGSGCGHQSRAERALNEKDSTIRRLEEQNAMTQLEKENAQRLALQAQEQNKLITEQVHTMTAQNVQQTNALRQQLTSMQSEMSALQAKLQANTGSSDVTVTSGNSKEPGAITIRVANTVLFDSGRATLKPGAERTLAEVAKTLTGQYANHYVRVEGHTDSTPDRAREHEEDVQGQHGTLAGPLQGRLGLAGQRRQGSLEPPLHGRLRLQPAGGLAREERRGQGQEPPRGYRDPAE
ncbi:MAG: OmpA family protein [Planctomycetota bacterium]|nr:OmpA family protein [Planctomycetota bacterium]